MTRHGSIAIRALATAAVAVVLAAGCGSDDAGDTSDASVTAPTGTGSTEGPAGTDDAPSDSTVSTVPATPDTTDATGTTSDPPDATASTSPAGPAEAEVGEVLVELEEPVDLAVRPGDDALYVVERAGRVRAIRDGQVVEEPLLDITDETVNEGEQGFLGLAFATDGAHAYVNYTNNDGDTVIEEIAVADDGMFDAASRRQLMLIDQPYPNHNGGDVVVGPDGMLYIGMGDGGAANDPERRALRLSSLLGKILRIDPTPSGDQPYTVPEDNPFVGTTGALPEIWTIGVRNPWRFSFDPATGDMWVADVGQNLLEEVDVLPATVDGLDAGKGASLGWSAFEGVNRFNVDLPDEGHVPPIHVYEHGEDGCSIAGGELYRGTAIPSLQGWYVFGDFCSGLVWALEVTPDLAAGRLVELGTLPALTAITAGPDGELYALSLDGEIRPIVGS